MMAFLVVRGVCTGFPTPSVGVGESIYLKNVNKYIRTSPCIWFV